MTEETYRSSRKPDPPPFPVGHRREGWPQLWGWADFVTASNRTDYALRYLRSEFADEFPEPVVVLGATPVYLADEARKFLDDHPKTHKAGLTSRQIKRIYELSDDGVGTTDIASALGIAGVTVRRYLADRKAGRRSMDDPTGRREQ